MFRYRLEWNFRIRRPMVASMWKARMAGKATLLSGLLASVTRLAVAEAPATSAADPEFAVELEADELALSCPDLPWFKVRIASHIGKAGQAGQPKPSRNERLTLSTSVVVTS